MGLFNRSANENGEKRKPGRPKGPSPPKTAGQMRELRLERERKDRNRRLAYLQGRFPELHDRMLLKEFGLVEADEPDGIEKLFKNYDRVRKMVRRVEGKEDGNAGWSDALRGLLEGETGRALVTTLAPAVQNALHREQQPALAQPEQPPAQPQPKQEQPTMQTNPQVAKQIEQIKAQIAGKSPRDVANLLKMAAPMRQDAAMLLNDMKTIPATVDGLADYLVNQMKASPALTDLWTWLAEGERFEWCLAVVREVQGAPAPRAAPAKGI